MQGRNEVEEILEQQAWAERNGLDLAPGAISYLTEEEVTRLSNQRGAYLPPAELLRAHEARTYRDCPIGYEDDPPVNWRLWLLVIGLLVLGLLIAGSRWTVHYQP